ncbi:MAG: MMPL family transporter [Actinobacteria bacterium]|nr:MMPL family transporter [Actinomycetota bacterium]
MSNVLYRIGRVCTRRRWRVLFAWVAIVIALVVVGKVAGGQFVDRLQIPGVESQKATNLLLETFPSQAGGSMQVVFHVPNGTISDGPAASAVTASLEAMATVPHVVQPAPALVKRVSSDGTTVLATVQFDDEVRALPRSVYYEVVATTEVATAAGVQVEFGGEFPRVMEQPSLSGTEGIGLLAAMVILLFAFGSVIAMGLPIGTALFGLGAGIAAITCLSAFVDMPSTSEMLASMIGLGVGIDYALFIITRHRAGLHRGLTVEDASGRSIATAGQAVLIAGGTVVIAICGLAVAGIPMITFMGIGAAIVVAVMVTSSLTLLPALMGFAGHNIDRFGLPGTKRVSEGSITNIDGEYHGWARWAQHVSRHPVVYLFVGLAFMLTLAAPILDLRLGQTDSSQSPTTSTLRRSYDLLAQGFGPGFNGPFVLAVNLEGATLPPEQVVEQLSAALTADPDVAEIARAAVGPDGKAAVIQVIPKSAPQDKETSELVARLRSSVLPDAVAVTSGTVYVGGQTATFIDLSDRVADRLPLFIGCVVGLSFLLLMIVFRSILVPLKAAIMNLLSIGAAYGVIVAVFQWGWGAELFGVHQSLPIVSFIPMFMFAILFGLSMDYEVFILSRIREEYNHSGDNTESVIVGITATARVITSAALIMISVFISFVFGGEPTIKMMGLGLATAVFVDATIIRMVLVPASMRLMGNANWWLPKFLDRIIPNLDIEGESRLPEAEYETSDHRTEESVSN